MFVVAIALLAVSPAFFVEAFRRATTNPPSGRATRGTTWPEVRLRKVVLGAFAWTVLVGAFFATVPLGEIPSTPGR